jgi:hypothetical protein
MTAVIHGPRGRVTHVTSVIRAPRESVSLPRGFNVRKRVFDLPAEAVASNALLNCGRGSTARLPAPVPDT